MEAAVPNPAPPVPPTFPAPFEPKGSLGKTYGGAIGVMGIGFAILEFLRDDPHETFRLLAQIGPKYLLGGFLAFIAWDLLRRGLKLLSRGVEHIGQLATNTGEVASAVQEYAGKNDRTADEMRRLCSFSAATSERAVEIALETKGVANRAVGLGEENNRLLHLVLAQSGTKDDKGDKS